MLYVSLNIGEASGAEEMLRGGFLSRVGIGVGVWTCCMGMYKRREAVSRQRRMTDELVLCSVAVAQCA